MNPQESRDLIKNTFENDFDRERYHTFIDRLLKNADFSKQFTQAGNRVFKVSQDKVISFERVAQFTDVDGNKIDILIVNLRRESTLERARTSLRNFAAEYLKSDRGIGKAAVLAAYAVKDSNAVYVPGTEWRFSFVTLETELVKQESGKFKETIDRLTPAKRFSFLVGHGERTHTAQKQFLDLLQSQSSPTLKQIEEAFSVEKVTKDFYNEYEKLFQRVEKEIKTLRQKPLLDKYFKDNFIESSDFAKKLLGQIVFLYFLQKKGWFGVRPNGKWGEGDKRYLRKLFDDRHKIAKSYASYQRKSKSFFHNVLEPLFYEALAYKRPGDVFAPFNARVPFLNGGLFEPSYEYKQVFIDLPDDLFSNRDLVNSEEEANGILDIFDRYNFTVNEAERLEKEVAIDPEMLGNVFENLLVKEERGESGTYYTPQVIVSYMCRQSLQNYLGMHLLNSNEQLTTIGDQLTLADLKDFLLHADLYGEHEASPTDAHEDKRFPLSIRKAAPEIDRLLCEVKICDPAIGSGAFPVGLLHEIVRLRQALVPLWKSKSSEEVNEQYSSYALKRYAIENSIYGVDKEQSAVDIARLRLWLSLIVDEDDLKDDKALPNLDYKIMQGNSLLDEYDGLPLIPKDFVRRETPKLVGAQDDKKTLLGKLSAEYVEESLRTSKRSMKAVRILRDIEDLKRQIEKDSAKPNPNESQSSLLQIESRTTAILDKLNEIHGRIFDEKDKIQKNKLRLQAEKLLLKYINTYLDESEANLRAAITSTEDKLEGEISNVRRSLKKDAETVEIARLRRILSAQQNELTRFITKRIELKKLWQTKNNARDKDTDLTKLDLADNITLRTKPFFLWELQFGEVFRRQGTTESIQQGFDIVIANPPYIRQEKLKEYKSAFERNYVTYTGTADILVYFYERAFNLLRHRGTLTFITSNKYFRAGYGEKLRRFLGSHATIKLIIDFGDAPVFEATAYASIILLQKQVDIGNQVRVWTFPQKEPVEHFEESFNRLGFYMPQSELKVEGWRLERPEVLRLLEKLYSRGRPLAEYIDARVYRGITTGLNEAFVVDVSTRETLLKEHASSEELLKPFLRGRDVERWSVQAQDLWLIFIPWHFPLHEDKKIKGASKKAEKEFAKRFPAIYRHLLKHKANLATRNATETGIRYEWYALQRWASDYWEEFEKPKIVSTKISIRPTFMLETSGCYLGNTSYFLPAPAASHYVLALLNSNLFHLYARKVFVEKQNSWFEIQPAGLETFPIPAATQQQEAVVTALVNYILYLKGNSRDEAGENLMIDYFETIINALVYELFLVEELHAANKYFFDPLEEESLPSLSNHLGEEPYVIRGIFDRLSARDHVIRRNLQFLNELESIRLIEGI
jgi:hypothetical protein